MSTTFISRSGSETSSGTIVLWYGTKATIPAGWAYYSAAVGKLVAGALTPDTTPLGNATHDHTYSANTGQDGSHNHSVSVSIGAPINATTPGHYGGGTTNAYWATKEHTNHNQSVNVSTAAAHAHSLQKTGTAANLPPSFGLYYIRKV
jgi:hypothetical protein